MKMECKKKENLENNINKNNNNNLDTPNGLTESNINNIDDLIEKLDLTKKQDMNHYLNLKLKTFKDNFELIEYMDCGSTGIVYKGKSTPGGNNQLYSFKFCIKTKKDKRRSNKYHEIFYQKSLHHLNICEILAFYKIDDSSYFSVSELGKFGNVDNFLHNFMKRCYLSETFVNYLAKPILEALNYMHGKKLLHMDIKKGNIVLDSDMNPKLIDFSSCFSFENYGPTDKIQFNKIGTGRYMPPEILNCKEIEIKYGDKIDVYCLGVTLYNLAFGCYPYGLNNVKGDDYDKIAETLKDAKLTFPEGFDVSDMFKDFLKNMLELSIYERYSIKDALNDKWIQGWEIISEEKENTILQENFIIRLIPDNIPKFNEFIKKENQI